MQSGLRGQKLHSSTRNYEWNLKKDKEFFPTHSYCIAYYSLMFFIAYAFKGQVLVFAGWVKIVLQDKCNIEIFLSSGAYRSMFIC